MNDPLFQPLTIGSLQLKNRIIMPAMHLNMAEDYRVSDRLLAFYAERAKGGAGLISCGYASIDELAAHPGHIGAHDDAFIPGLRRLAETIRDGGARAAIQINHAGRYNHSMLTGGRQPVAPSPVPSRLTGETPRALSEDEIEGLIQAFAEAARRVAEAGFDAVEVLAGTGYIISSFLSPLTNRREDGWGGSRQNRMRFGVEVVRQVKQASGLPLIVRLNGNDFMPGGIGRELMQEFAQALVAAGADALSVNVGWHEAQMPQIVTKVPRGAFAYLARGIRQRVEVPVIAGHRINDPADARRLIAEDWCDAVAMGRALIADPQLPDKAAAGREGEIVHCVACGQGCFDALFRFQHVECLCNPRAGHELEEVPAPAEPRRVLVVGGGAGGMTAAIAAARQGHRVTLMEAGPRLGGQLELAGAPPGREEFVLLARDLARQVVEVGVEVVLERRVDAELLRQQRPDQVILATGGEPQAPPIPGSDLPHVVQAWDLLRGKAETGRRVVIVGGGAVGIESALLLAEQGTLPAETLRFLLVHRAEEPEELYRLATTGCKQVTIVEMLDKLGRNFGKTTRWTMLQDLDRYGVACRTGVRVEAITPEGVVLAGEAEQELLPADTVVLATGTRAENPLQAACEELDIPCQVIGDARRPAMVFDAVHQGYRAGREVT
ncbi:2,4-dienoyl-CoA reductase (NADPH2) [Geothermobacter ehrlichii]|uniref:2,4-dienoyl-CoA reductase (NADPH2) n=1 Tax=Geothermobacter ehrlichii TaxID=213224 RepID=A0A5D3WIE4_9BACT|nr:FAD-dependent oxidoreductase [Geothermobacter ehrlichii]TYO95825.1 2,4-dienoyl-CoA reductase (NADPH2) [Geothermobacter ehrlichii]